MSDPTIAVGGAGARSRCMERWNCMSGPIAVSVVCAVMMGVVCSVGGCKSQPRGEGEPVPLHAVRGINWRLVTLGKQAVPEKPEITLTLAEDGKIHGSTGVNRYFGSYESPAAGSLRFGQMGSTRMAGEPAAMQRETDFVNTMERVRGYTVEGNTLNLNDGTATILVFRRSN